MSDIKLEDIVTTKKPHACGGKTWKIVRVGADYKLKCLTCGKIVMLDKEKALKVIKKVNDGKEE